MPSSELNPTRPALMTSRPKAINEILSVGSALWAIHSCPAVNTLWLAIDANAITRLMATRLGQDPAS